MIESVCVMLLVIIARITAEVYAVNWNWLAQFIAPLDIGIAVAAAVVAFFVVLKVVAAIRKTRSRDKDNDSSGQ